MVDASGSTLQTDPQKLYRGKTVQDFVLDYGSKPNLSFAFGMFSISASLYDVNTSAFSANAGAPFAGSQYLSSALNLFLATPDVATATTNYRAGFSVVEAAIIRDEIAYPKKSDYAVVFMSDGQPKDIENASGIESLITNFVSSVESRGSGVTVSSVYFGPSSETRAISYMQLIASEGMGQFVDTNQLGGADLSIADIVVVPGQTCSQK